MIARDDVIPTRIARIIARLNVGGPARHVTWLTAALSGGEFDTVLLTGSIPPGEEDMSSFALERGVHPIVIPGMSREISPRDVTTIWTLFRFFRRYRPDIVHTHTAKAGAVGRAAGLLYRLLTRGVRVRFIHTYHGHIFHSYYRGLTTGVFLLIERLLARLNTDIIIVLSDQQMREIHETFRVGRREQFRIVPLGIDFRDCIAPTRDPSARAALGIGTDELLVGVVGRLTGIKNHDLFLRVAAKAGPPGRVRFVVYGDGADRRALEKRSADLHAEAIFAGTRSPQEIYGSIDIAALTSLNEGTPLTIIEALANGIPVISTAVGGVVDVLGPIEETVRDGGATYEIRARGITVASNDESGFLAGLGRLTSDPALCRSLSERGRAYAHAAFSRERLVADIIRIYREFRGS